LREIPSGHIDTPNQAASTLMDVSGNENSRNAHAAAGILGQQEVSS
jgi:hypothetical protein